MRNGERRWKMIEVRGKNGEREIMKNGEGRMGRGQGEWSPREKERIGKTARVA